MERAETENKGNVWGLVTCKRLEEKDDLKRETDSKESEDLPHTSSKTYHNLLYHRFLEDQLQLCCRPSFI